MRISAKNQIRGVVTSVIHGSSYSRVSVEQTDADGNVTGYQLNYTAQRDGTFDYTIIDQSNNREVKWNDLDNIAKWNMIPQHIRNKQKKSER